MKKQDVLELVQQMPGEIDADELIYRLYLKQKLETAEAAVAAGDIIPHEEVVRLTGEWHE